MNRTLTKIKRSFIWLKDPRWQIIDISLSRWCIHSRRRRMRLFKFSGFVFGILLVAVSWIGCCPSEVCAWW